MILFNHLFCVTLRMKGCYLAAICASQKCVLYNVTEVLTRSVNNVTLLMSKYYFGAKCN